MKNAVIRSSVNKLHKKVESSLEMKAMKTVLSISEAEVLRLIHKFEAKQLELEVANKELKLAKELAEIVTEKYLRLYDFAPSGYLALSKDGEIIEMNFTCANIFGKERSQLINSRFGLYVSNDTKPILKRFLDEVFNTRSIGSCEIELLTNDNPPINVQITGIVSKKEEQCFVTVVDIALRKQEEDKLKKLHDQLKMLYIHQDEVKENERKVIAREIHDELGQLLTALKIDIGWTRDNIENKVEIKKRTKGMNDIINETIEIVQRISSDLRPGLLDDLGLVPSMEWYCQKFEKRTGLKCLFKSDDIQSTHEKINLTLYRILQETLTNVIRHAKAKNVAVNLLREKGDIILEIIDDGRGMTQEKIDSFDSLGIIGIRERVKQYNGSLNITSAINKGTKLRIEIPYIQKLI
jgi:signal transduction histidine kinase